MTAPVIAIVDDDVYIGDMLEELLVKIPRVEDAVHAAQALLHLRAQASVGI